MEPVTVASPVTGQSQHTSPRQTSTGPVETQPEHIVRVEGQPDPESPTFVKWRLGLSSLRRSDSASGKRRGSKLKSLPLVAALRDRTLYALDRWNKEKILLKANWKILLVCGIFQYLHSVATNVAYYLHVQRQPLYDLGFQLLPALSRQMQILSEIMFFVLFFSVISFAVSPFFRRDRSHLFTVQMGTRFLMVCFAAQFLRCISFLVTALPGPNYHCRPGSLDYSPPQNLYDIFLRQDAFYGCGDLVFSSHTIFVLLCALSYGRYADCYWTKRLIWVLVVVFGGMVIAARKHYTLDIVVAWYTVPLLWVACERYFPDRIPAELADILNKERQENEALPIKDLKEIV